MLRPAVLRFRVVILALLVAGCEDKKPAPVAAGVAGPPAAGVALPAVEDTSFRYPNAERIVAIGDLHGDLAATRAALRLAGALGEDDHWSGGKLVVVQTGDQLDRGDDEPQILDLLERLAAEASAAGGAVHVLNGNHEVMNVQGDFRYVTADGFHDFAELKGDGHHEHELLELPAAERGRGAAFLSGGRIAKRLAEHPVVIQVGDSVFVHGGLLERHLRYGLGRINREIQAWMREPESHAAPRASTDENGPLWLRAYSKGVPSTSDCAELARVLAALSAKRLVVGHTVQPRGINAACGGNVWRIDVGMSRAFHDPGSTSTPVSVLEIKGAETHVLEGAVPSPRPSSAASSAASSASSVVKRLTTE